MTRSQDLWASDQGRHEQITKDMEHKWMDEDRASEAARTERQENDAWDAYRQTIDAEREREAGS